MTQQGYPSKNPANDGTLVGVFSNIMDKVLQNTDDCLPATVLKYDRTTNTATVRPLVSVKTTDGSNVPRAAIASVPVFAFGAGEFVINYPVKPGDLGWIKATDRDNCLFRQSLGEAVPNTVRKHSFEDGIFFPDMIRNFTVDAEDTADNMVIQSRDGKIRVSLWPDRVKTTANDTSVDVNGDGTVTVVAPEKIMLDSPLVEIAGIFKSGTKHGDLISEMNGGLKTTMDQIAGGVSTMEHRHIKVQSGGGESGPPATP